MHIREVCDNYSIRSSSDWNYFHETIAHLQQFRTDKLSIFFFKSEALTFFLASFIEFFQIWPEKVSTYRKIFAPFCLSQLCVVGFLI